MVSSRLFLKWGRVVILTMIITIIVSVVCLVNTSIRTGVAVIGIAVLQPCHHGRCGHGDIVDHCCVQGRSQRAHQEVPDVEASGGLPSTRCQSPSPKRKSVKITLV